MGLKSVISLLTVSIVGIGIIVKFYLAHDASPVVSTESGKMQGIVMKSRSGRPFYGYFGIPFAKPPVGEKRFKSPVKPEKWDGIWDGSYSRPMCTQFDFLVTGLTIGSEDCLYLNVFLPKIEESTTKSNRLPVMVHIHGGYFHMGGTELQGPHFFMDHDVIIVTIAYRLGILGFLNTGDDVVRGNMGLKDQNLALQWVQENIKNFGGDPDRVTIFGESAGAVSVQHHMLNPKSKGLFSRAIRQSGSALNYWGLMTSETTNHQAKTFAQKFNCPLDTTRNMVSCLQTIDASTLVSGHVDLLEYPTPQRPKFVPSVETVKDEDAFLTEHPGDIVKSGRFQRVPLLSGFNVDEGILHSAVLSANETKLGEAIDDWFNWAPRAFHYTPERRDVSQKLFDFYIAPFAKGDLNRRGLLQNLTNAYGDRLFINGIVESVQHEQKYVNVYNYIYDHHGGFNTGTVFSFSQAMIHPILTAAKKVIEVFILNRILGIDVPADFPGTCHVDELALLWYNPLFSVFFSERNDLHFSKDLVQLWVDFATEKNPLNFRGVAFPSSNEDEPLKFVRLHARNVEIIQDPFLARIKFWRNLAIKN